MTAHPLDSLREAPSSTRRSVALVCLAALLIAGGAVGVARTTGVASAQEGAVGCGYGVDGPYADNLCWIDLSAYDHAQASGAGQPMSVELPGGYTVDFTVRASGDGAAAPSPFPTWFLAPVGTVIYVDTPGAPAIYTIPGTGFDVTISLDDIEVTDSAGNAVGGWRFVGTDAEATALNESITFTADVPVDVLAIYDRDGEANNGCQYNIEQIDANTIRCTGISETVDNYGTLLVAATTPTSFSQTMTLSNVFSAQGVAFAIQTSRITANATVENRVDESDSFEVSVVSPEDQVVGAGDTGTSDAASTGTLTVLPRVDGSAYTLRVTGGGGTDLGAYSFGWECWRDGAPDPSLTTTGDSLEVSPDAGEEVVCTVTVSVGGSGPAGTTPASPVAGSPSFTG